MSADAPIAEELKKKAERMKRTCPNLSIAGYIVVPTDNIESGKAFLLMNRQEYIGILKELSGAEATNSTIGGTAAAEEGRA